MTAPDGTGIPGSRSTPQTAGQALPPLPPKWSRAYDTLAIAAFAAWHGITDDIPGAWNAQDGRSRNNWRVTVEAVQAAIAAAAPAPAAEGTLLTAKQERQPSREVNLITDDERDQP